MTRAGGDVSYKTGHFGKWHLNGKSGPGKPVAEDDPLKKPEVVTRMSKVPDEWTASVRQSQTGADYRK